MRRLRFLRARRAVDGDRPAEAIDDLEKILADERLDPAAHYLLGRARLALGEVEEALEHLTLAAQLAPERPAWSLELARACSAADRPHKAYVAYKDFLDGTTSLPAKEAQEWATAVQEARDYQDDCARLYRAGVLAGDASRGSEDWEGSRGNYGEALRFHPTGESALYGMVVSLLRMSEPIEAEIHLRRLLSHHPRSASGLVLGARYYWYHVQDESRARELLEDYLRFHADGEYVEEVRELLALLPENGEQ